MNRMNCVRDRTRKKKSTFRLVKSRLHRRALKGPACILDTCTSTENRGNQHTVLGRSNFRTSMEAAV